MFDLLYNVLFVVGLVLAVAVTLVTVGGIVLAVVVLLLELVSTEEQSNERGDLNGLQRHHCD